MESLFQDVRWAIRGLRNSPGFTAVAVATLALGIGANAAIFSVINAALLKAVPFPNPDRVVLLFERDVTAVGSGRNIVALGNFLDWEAQSRSFVAMGAVRQNSFNLGDAGNHLQPERIRGSICSWGLWPALGVAPQLGRTFLREEDRPGGRHVAVISHGLWQRRFGGAPDILGRQIRLDSENYDIVGVMPHDFAYPARNIDVWTPVQQAMNPEQIPHRGNHQFYVVARVRPGISLDRAAADVDAIERRIYADHSNTLAGRGAALYPMAEISTQRSRQALIVLFAAVGCLLLIACVNIANLLLARGSRRRRELAIRMALGAGRARLVRQMLTESVLLSVMGALAGLLLAGWLVALLSAAAPALLNSGDIDTSAEIALDRLVFAFTAIVAVGAGVATGLFPAWQASRTELAGYLKEGGRAVSAGRGQRRFRGTLVAAEVGLSMLLLVAAGLLTRSFAELRRVHPGSRVDHLLTAGLDLPNARYRTRQQISTFGRQLEDRLAALPGVRSMGLVSCLPVGGYCGDQAFFIEGRPLPAGQFIFALTRAADPGYFQTAGIPLLSGRVFTSQDGRGFDDQHPHDGVVVISESMAREFWPAGDALDKRIFFGDDPKDPRFRIVGIVGDVLTDLDDHPRPTLYTPLLDGFRSTFYALVRTDGEPAASAAAVRREIGSLDADLPAFEVRTMDEVLEQSAGRRRFTVLLLVCFAGAAVLLAAIGIYGVLSYSVAQRTSEIGLRLALGAGYAQVHRLVLSEGMRPVLVGIALGWLAAMAAARLLGNLLFGVRPGDPATFLSVPVLLVAVAAVACFVPSWRATRVDPMLALRGE